MAAFMCAFMSMHLEDEAERKILGYVLKGETDVEIVSKKWARVPEEHKEWLWGKVEGKIQADPNITPEQKKRFEEVKKALKL
jgi:hypothetical protein